MQISHTQTQTQTRTHKHKHKHTSDFLYTCQNEAKMNPKLKQNLEKYTGNQTMPPRLICCILFRILLQFWGHFGFILDPKTDPKSIQVQLSAYFPGFCFGFEIILASFSIPKPI